MRLGDRVAIQILPQKQVLKILIVYVYLSIGV
jgi:hypothetical protein